MGLLNPSGGELDLLRKMFEEKCRLIGVSGIYLELKDLHLDRLSNWSPEHFNGVEISYIFEEIPTPKTLKGLNWWDDDDNTTPPIAYLPWHLPNGQVLLPKQAAYIGLASPGYAGNTDFLHQRFFEITEVNSNDYYEVYSIVKLAPLREDLNVDGSVDEVRQQRTPEQEAGNAQPVLLNKRTIG